jgi:hypothetical protein
MTYTRIAGFRAGMSATPRASTTARETPATTASEP